MNPQTLQLINTIAAALIIAAIIGIAKWITGKADKSEIASLRAENAKLEVKLDAALLIVGAAVQRPELTEKILAMTGRSDDRIQRIVADIVQLTTDGKATAKAAADTDKRLDDLPGRVRTLEDKSKT